MHGMMDTMIQAIADTLIAYSSTDYDEENASYAAPLAAAEFAGVLRFANGMSLLCLLAAAARCDGVGFPSRDFAESFARAITLEAMGHGVKWTDAHRAVRVRNGVREFADMKVPPIDGDELVNSHILV